MRSRSSSVSFPHCPFSFPRSWFQSPFTVSQFIHLLAVCSFMCPTLQPVALEIGRQVVRMVVAICRMWPPIARNNVLIKTAQCIETMPHFVDDDRINGRSTFQCAQVFDFVSCENHS